MVQTEDINLLDYIGVIEIPIELGVVERLVDVSLNRTSN
jgi:hypothetical protein